MTSLRIFAALCLAATLSWSSPGIAQSTEIIFIDYDDATARQHGEFPTRAQLARITERLHEAKARAVLLKFFLDGPGDAAGNAALAKALSQGRSLLQASISQDPPTTRALDARFHHAGPLNGITPAISGSEGWLPLPTFAQAAARICFAEVVTPARVPLFEIFNGKPVPTLYHCLLSETAAPGNAELKPGLARFGSRSWALNNAGEISLKLSGVPALPRIAASRLLGSDSDWRNSVQGKLAIVMYSGPKSPRIEVSGQSMKVHDGFELQTAALMMAAQTSAR